MRGIPVRSNGDPVTRTFVLAGNYHQFSNWCMFSRVNPRSKLVRYISNDHCLRGCKDFDLVYTGTWIDRRDIHMIAETLRYLELVKAILVSYSQFESCEIEPYVVDDVARELCKSDGVDCPDPDNHILNPDGTVGPHAWVIQAIKDARGTD